MKFEIYRQKNRDWRWRLRARNGRIIANSGEGYRRSSDCLRAINMVRVGTDSTTPIEDVR